MVERYNVDVEKNENGYWEGVLLVSANGAWVSYSDCADLAHQVAELRKVVDRSIERELLAKSRAEAAEAENARLRALPLKDEVERLRPHYQSNTATDIARRQMLDHFEAFALRAGEQEEADAEVEYEVWQHGEPAASSTDYNDALHYLSVYSQDGPADLFKLTRIKIAAPSEQGGDRG